MDPAKLDEFEAKVMMEKLTPIYHPRKVTQSVLKKMHPPTEAAKHTISKARPRGPSCFPRVSNTLHLSCQGFFCLSFVCQWQDIKERRSANKAFSFLILSPSQGCEECVSNDQAVSTGAEYADSQMRSA